MRGITIYSDDSLQHIRVAAKLAADILDWIIPCVVEGVTTNSLDLLCRQKITESGAESGYLKYRGFDKSIYASVNEVVSRGRPNNRRLTSGDILNIDISVIKNGFFGHASRMFSVGNVDMAKTNLIDSAYTALLAGIASVKPGVSFQVITDAIFDTVERLGCKLVVKCIGHGIGESRHASPFILADEGSACHVLLKKGMIFTLDPVLSLGSAHLEIAQDGLSIVNTSEYVIAHWEHMVEVTESGYSILTASFREGDTLSYPLINQTLFDFWSPNQYR